MRKNNGILPTSFLDASSAIGRDCHKYSTHRAEIIIYNSYNSVVIQKQGRDVKAKWDQVCIKCLVLTF